mmetsp:Transcript_30499/g.55283  ORF Transcript_30499/g.55283 Transcript_30499/m.55283 type:complete len:1464 (+) Transcript_30499:28-4419(+)
MVLQPPRRGKRWPGQRSTWLLSKLVVAAGAGALFATIGFASWSFQANHAPWDRQAGGSIRKHCEKARCRRIPRQQAAQQEDTSLRADRYQRLTMRDHVLKRPDMYIGPVDPREESAWILRTDGGSTTMMEEDLRLSPGLVQCFNEILVNALDRQFAESDGKQMTEIRIGVNQEENEISVWNNGGAIPVERHASGPYVPSLVFGEFLSGDNFDDSMVRFTGGRNGVGAKATNAFSTVFEVQSDDPGTGKRFLQRWEDNMGNRLEPVISDLPSDVTRGSVGVRYKPDLRRFGLQKLDDDHVRFMQARAWDAAACSRPDVTVSFNGEPLQVKGFQDFSEALLGTDFAVESILDKKGNVRAEVSIAFAKNRGYGAIGFVNGIRCSLGTHVDRVVKDLSDGIAKLAGGSKKKLSIAHVKPYLRLAVKVLVDNPEFDSQTKTKLSTPHTKLGFELSLTKDFVKRVAELGVLDAALQAVMANEKKQLQKVFSAAPRPSVAKLEDARDAGKQNVNCTLIVTEGDSAKALAMAALAKIGRETYGVFPLKGKPLNVRAVTMNRIAENEEIKNLMRIIGLDIGKQYKTWDDVRRLRYKRLMVFADQDLDGHHIAGLLVNLIVHLWPSLLKVHPDFIQRFSTPIVKVFNQRSGQAVKEFFTQGAFAEWQRAEGEDWNRRYRAKYYKGLGTSTRAEAIEYFTTPEKHILGLHFDGKKSEDAIKLAFAPELAAGRKKWLAKHDPSKELDYSQSSVTISEFMNQQFIHFSSFDCTRSIPLLLDGLKPTQRKVLYWSMKRLKTEKQVAQMIGLVSSETAYHHGEKSLEQTIVGLAQDFVGANNLNMLEPAGMFGSRLHGRETYASARYIHTAPSKLMPFVFRKEDLDIMVPQFEDGKYIEPRSLLPVLPLGILNGWLGIGTGWASTCPNYNPLEVAAVLEHLIETDGKLPARKLKPWYKHFEGSTVTTDGKPTSEGKWRVFSSVGDDRYDTVEITELPIAAWTEDYVKFVEDKARKDGMLMSVYKCSDHNDQRVHLLVGFNAFELEKLAKSGEDLHRAIGIHLKLIRPLQSNLNLFDSEDGSEIGPETPLKLMQYKDVKQVIKAFHRARLPFYHNRKAMMMQKLSHKVSALKNQVRCIQMCQDGQLSLASFTACTLKEEGFDRLSVKGEAEGSQIATDEAPDQEAEESEAGFEYLLDMPARSFSQEKATQLQMRLQGFEEELETVSATSANAMWLEDLRQFKDAYTKALEKEPKIPAAILSREDKKMAEAQFRKERKKTHRSDAQAAQVEEEIASDPAWLSKQTISKLKELCGTRGLLPKTSSPKKKDWLNALVVYASRAYTERDYANMKATDLTRYLKAREVLEVGTKPEKVQRLVEASALEFLKFDPAYINEQLKVHEVNLPSKVDNTRLEACWKSFLSQEVQEAETLKARTKEELLQIAGNDSEEPTTKELLISQIARRKAVQSLHSSQECKALQR